MKTLLALFAALISLTTLAQGVPDWDIIEGKVKDPASQYYYPTLMARYKNSDTTLTQSDYYYLYYGYSLEKEYKPLLKTNYSDSLSMIFASRLTPQGDEMQRIVRYCNAILSVEPFNLRDLNVLAFAYQNLGQKELAAQQMHKVAMLVEAIKSTGDGLTEDKPWWIIYKESAEDILNIMEAEPGRRIIINNQVEFIACRKTPSKQTKGYYFNYSEIYKRKPDYLEEAGRPKRKLEVNPDKSKKYELAQ